MPEDPDGVTQRLDLLLAEWVLDRVASERVPQLAVRALEEGCEAPTVALLAGLRGPTRAEIEDVMPRLLTDTGRVRPTRIQAVKALADHVFRQVDDGTLQPVAGATAVWALWGYSEEGDEASPMWQDIRPFIGWASECESPGPHVAQYEQDIRRYTAELLARGGLRV